MTRKFLLYPNIVVCVVYCWRGRVLARAVAV